MVGYRSTKPILCYWGRTSSLSESCLIFNEKTHPLEKINKGSEGLKNRTIEGDLRRRIHDLGERASSIPMPSTHTSLQVNVEAYLNHLHHGGINSLKPPLKKRCQEKTQVRFDTLEAFWSLKVQIFGGKIIQLFMTQDLGLWRIQSTFQQPDWIILEK